MTDSSDSNSESVSNTTPVNEDKKTEQQPTRRQFLGAVSKVLAVSVATEAAVGALATSSVTKAKQILDDTPPSRNVQKSELTQSAVDGAISGALTAGGIVGLNVYNNKDSPPTFEIPEYTRRDCLKVFGAAVAGSAVGMASGKVLTDNIPPEYKTRKTDILLPAIGGYYGGIHAGAIMRSSVDKRKALVEKREQERLAKLERTFSDEPEEGRSR